MQMDQLIVCIRDIDQLTQEELTDLEFIRDRVETHLDVCGFDESLFDVDKLAADIQQELLDKKS